jgi:uncharacterized cupin superfamily protein
MKSMLVATAILVMGCAGAEEAIGDSAAALQTGEMIVYEPGHAVPQEELTDLGPPAGLGGTVLDGDPHIAARIDYANEGLLGGVFQATRGKVLVHFPFTEHATVLRGAFTLTDETGRTHRFQVGDSYLIKQGSDIRWEVGGPSVQKSFFNFTQP